MTCDGTELLSRAAAGDAEAFGEFFDAHAPALLRYFQLRTAAADVAADLCAETFAAALGSLHRFDASMGSGVGWLYGVARNKLMSWLRAERVERQACERLGVTAPVAVLDDLDLVELRVDLSDQLGFLPSALGSLSDGVRLAVTRRVLDGVPYNVLAAELGCSPVAARVRVSRGLSSLLARFEDQRELS
jgi:RNA polymerase sigma-70 factor (ECF subfamily)